MSAQAISSEKPKLYSVTLSWGASSSDEGTYSTHVWAANEVTAQRFVAEEMADNSGTAFSSAAAREAYITARISSADYSPRLVADRLHADLTELLKGPTGNLSEQAKADLDTIQVMLNKYDI